MGRDQHDVGQIRGGPCEVDPAAKGYSGRHVRFRQHGGVCPAGAVAGVRGRLGDARCEGRFGRIAEWFDEGCFEIRAEELVRGWFARLHALSLVVGRSDVP